MKNEHSIIIENKLKEIIEETHRHELTMRKLREDLLSCAAYFESYGEMYTYIKAHTPNFEAFCTDMKDALPIFYKAEEERLNKENIKRKLNE